MRRRIFLQHLVHSSSWEHAKHLWRVHSWIHTSSHSRYMVRDMFLHWLICILLSLFLQCMALQAGKPIRFLHGQDWAKLYDGGSHLSHGLWKNCFHCIHAQIIYIISHESQSILQCKFLKQQLGKLRCHYQGNCWYLLASHETFRNFLILLLIMTSFLIWIRFVKEA